MTPVFHRVTNITKISSIGSAVSPQIMLVTDGRTHACMDGLNMALALPTVGQISVYFLRHPGLLLEKLEREREVAERGTEQRAGVTEIGLSGKRKICRSRSTHMRCCTAGRTQTKAGTFAPRIFLLGQTPPTSSPHPVVSTITQRNACKQRTLRSA